MKDITIVTAFFDIGRGGDKYEIRRGVEQYFKYFDFWARIRNNLVVYVAPQDKENVLAIRKKYNLDKNTVVVEIDNVYSVFPELFNRMNAVANSKFREYRYYINSMSDDARYDYIMMMKYWFLQDAVERNLVSGMVAWVDFGFNHGGVCYPVAEEFDFIWEWDFSDKIHIFTLNDVNNVLPIASLQLQFDTIMGMIVVCPKEKTKILRDLILKAMDALLMLQCIDDDQQLLLMACRERPELFEVHRSTWYLPLKEYGGTHLTVVERKKKKQHTKQISRIKRKYNILREGFYTRLEEYIEDYYR